MGRGELQLTALVMLLPALVVCGHPAQATLITETLTVRAYVDGSSDLHLQGSTAQWHNWYYAFPGTHGLTVENHLPTYLDGTPWFPSWPTAPPSYDGNHWSEKYTALSPALPSTDMTVSLNVVYTRGPTTIVQSPAAANDYTLVVRFNDYAPGGAYWYESDISFTYESAAAVPEPASLALLALATGGIGAMLRKRRK